MALAYNGGMLGLHPRRHGSIPCRATTKNKLKNKKMDFTCAHCGKTITCFGVVVDKQHFVHSTCEAEFIETLEQIDKLFVGTEDENLTEVE